MKAIRMLVNGLLIVSMLASAQGLWAHAGIGGTSTRLADAAKQLDSLSQGGGPTAAMNQKIQE